MKKPWLILTLIEAVVLIFLVQSVGSSLALSPVSSSSPPAVSFPYQYGTPVVPKDVGAQGPTGLTVPKSDIGVQVPLSDLGPNGTVGRIGIPNSQQLAFLNGSAVSVSIRAFNGSAIASPVPAVKQEIVLQNLTYGNKTTVYTNAHGYANFTLTKGFWQVEGYASDTSLYMNYSLTLDLHSSISKTIYFIPTSAWNPSVDNGGTSRTNVWITNIPIQSTIGFYGNPDSTFVEPLEAELINDSASSPTVISQTVFQFNGSAGFANVNRAYSYTLKIEGHYNNLTATQYDVTNQTNGPLTFSTGTYVWNVDGSQALWALNTMKGGSISGSSMPQNGNWVISTKTVVNDSFLIISKGVVSSSYSDLYINNSILILNLTVGERSAALPHIFVYNTTVMVFGRINFNAYNLVPISAVHSVIVGGGMVQPTEALLNVSNSLVYDMSIADSSISLPFSYWTNDTISINQTFAKSNADVILFGKAYLNLGQQSISHSLFTGNLNLALSMSNLSIEYSVMQGINYFREEPIITGSSLVVKNFSIENSYINGLLNTANEAGANYGNFSHNDVVLNGTISSSGTMVTTILPDNSTMLYNNISIGKDLNFTIGASAFYVFSTDANSLVENNIVYDVYNSLTNPNINSTYFISIGSIGTKGNPSVVSHNLLYFGGIIAIWANVTNNDFAYVLFVDIAINGYFPPSQGNLTVTNNTFGYLVWNQIYFRWASYHSTVSAGGTTFFSSPSNAGPTNITFSYNTMNTFIAGGGDGGPAQAIEGPANFTVKDNLFENSLVIGQRYAQANYSAEMDFNQFGYARQVVHDVVADNYFLNLSVYARPFQFNPAPGKETVTFTGNHYYYAPAPGASQVPLWAYYGQSLNGSSSSFSDYGYVFNSTVITKFFVNATNFNYVYYGYKYVIVPDVNVLSGVPDISYANGLVGGPQPNFTWQGYTYTENVEPSYVEVGVNSTVSSSVAKIHPAVAPSVVVSLVGTPYTQYLLTETDMTGGGGISKQTVETNGQGLVNVTYDPAYMTSLMLFSLGPLAGGGSSSPPSGGNSSGGCSGVCLPSLHLTVSMVGLAIVIAGILLVVFGPGRVKVAGVLILIIGIVVMFL